jgi:GTP cyclohydrolase II
LNLLNLCLICLHMHSVASCLPALTNSEDAIKFAWLTNISICADEGALRRSLFDPNVKLALRVHDECNGSDVFGSDICTCRPYLLFGIEEAVKEAQNGGSGVVIYFRKEGRALGEVTKVCRSTVRSG